MSAHPCKPYHVCATVNRRCLGMLLLRSILRRSLGEFLGEITGESLGDTDFLEVLGFSCCNRFSRKDFTRSSFSQGFGQCGLSTSGTVKVSGLVVCWAIFAVNFVHLAVIQDNVVAWPLSSDCLARAPGERSGEAGRSQPLLVHSAACLSLSAETGLGAGEASALHGGSLANVTPPLPIPCQGSPPSSRGRGTWREATASEAFVSATKQPAKLLELMRRSCSSDFCLCT